MLKKWIENIPEVDSKIKDYSFHKKTRVNFVIQTGKILAELKEKFPDVENDILENEINPACVIMHTGGDCQGLNPAVFHLRKEMRAHNFRVLGSENGFEGMYTGNVREIKKWEVFKWFKEAGGFLGSKRGEICEENHEDSEKPFIDLQAVDKINKFCIENNVKVIYFTGGNGSMAQADFLSKHFIVPLIGIPKTIDGDTPFTYYSIGFKSSVNRLAEQIYNLFSASYGHKYTMIIESMGRDSGRLSVYGSKKYIDENWIEALILPEAEFIYEEIRDKLLASQNSGERKARIVVLAEGVKIPKEDIDKLKYKNMSISKYLLTRLAEDGLSVRRNKPGHVLRGGIISQKDFKYAKKFSKAAVNFFFNGAFNLMTSLEEDGVVSRDFHSIRKKGSTSMDLDSALINEFKNENTYIGPKKKMA